LFEQLSKLFKNTMLYGTHDVLEKATALLLIPVYTAFLTPREYGIISLMTLVISTLLIIYLSGQHGAALRYYFDYKNDPARKKAMLGSIFFYLLLLPLFLCLLLVLLGDSIFSSIFKDIPYYPYGLLTVLASFFLVVPQLKLTIWMAGESVKSYMTFSIARFVLSTLLILLFIVVFRWGAAGKLLGNTIGYGIFWIVAVVLMLKETGLKVSGKELKISLNYSLPLVPHLLAGLVLTMADRYMLDYFRDLTEVGIYSLGYNLGSVMFFLAAAFEKSWFPFFFSTAESKEAKEILPRVATYFATFSIFITLVLALFAREIVTLLADPSYMQAYTVIPVIALGILFNSIYLIPVKIFFYNKKTRAIFLFTGVAALVNIGLNLWLIPLYGMYGAAWATVGGYLSLFILVYQGSQKLFYIQYEISRLLSVAVTAIIIYILNQLLFNSIQTAVWQAVLIKTGLMATGVFGLYYAGFFNKQEIKIIKTLIKRKYSGNL